MKKLIAIVLCLCMVCSMAVCVSAAEEDCVPYAVEGGNIYFNPTTGMVESSDKTITKAVIPETINGVSVTALRLFAFGNCNALTEVVLPDSLTEIGDFCFDSCRSLEKVHFGTNLARIGEHAFRYCQSLTEVVLQSPVASIEDGAFEGCVFLTKAVLGTGKLTIGNRAFYSLPLLTDLTISPSTVRIGEAAFVGAAFTSIEVPAGCSLGKGVFNGNKVLKSAVLGEGIDSIPESLFYGCLSLESIIIPASVASIQFGAFMNCHALRSVGFRGNCPTVEGFAFENTAEFPNRPAPSHIMYYMLENATGFEEFFSPDRLYTWDGVTLPILPLPPFRDIFEEDWFYVPVCRAYSDSLMNGVEENIFKPNSPMTRAMLVTVLWRYAGEVEEGTNPFTDVPANQWYTKAVVWAVKNQVVNGTSATTFSPDDNVSREQMAAILYRYAKSVGLDVSKQKTLTDFPDASQVSDYATEALSWCVAEGIIGGSDGKLEPQGNATRAQVAAILMRFIDNVVNK